jgi:ATP-binding cassette subfamily F protein 3
LEKIGWEEEEGKVKVKKQKPKINHKERKKLRKAVTQARNEVRKPYSKEIKLCEEKIEKLEVELNIKNKALEIASNSGDNSAIMEHSKKVGLVQQEVDAYFERLEVASEKDEAIVAEYDLKLEEIDK